MLLYSYLLLVFTGILIFLGYQSYKPAMKSNYYFEAFNQIPVRTVGSIQATIISLCTVFFQCFKKKEAITCL